MLEIQAWSPKQSGKRCMQRRGFRYLGSGQVCKTELIKRDEDLGVQDNAEMK